MKNLFFLCMVLGNLSMLFSQQSEPVFALESNLKDNRHWTDLRILNTINGFSSNHTSSQTDQADQAAVFTSFTNQQLFEQGSNMGSAAVAFDGKTQRLFYVSLLTGALHYSDLNGTAGPSKKSMGNIYQALHTAIPEMGPQNQGKLITRLTASPDGYIYGLSNDGTLFFRVNAATPDKIEPQVFVFNEMAPSFLSFQNQALGWGGDMVSDASGNLVVFSASGNVFTVDMQHKAISHTGKIFGLPVDFSLSGAAVQESGAVLLCGSAGKQLFEISDMKTLRAQHANVSLSAGCGDLASAVFLNNRNIARMSITAQALEINAYPNPVTGGMLYLQFKGLPAAEAMFTLELMNTLGQTQMRQTKSMSQKTNQVSIGLQQVKPGAYYVKVTGKADYTSVVRIVVP